MNKILPIALLFATLISCSDNYEKPDLFLEHDDMVNLMTDLSLAEGTRGVVRTSDRANKDNKLLVSDYYALVFEKYNITKGQLDSINAWYVRNPKEYKLIFKEVLDRLNKMQAEEKAKTKANNQLKTIDNK